MTSKTKRITESAMLLAVAIVLELVSKAVIPDTETGRYAPGSIAFCPPAAGFLLASRVVRDIIGRP